MAEHSSRRSALRTDIQGLRTIAVLAVLIYHVTPAHLTGGFVGVDIFFVISGFLITAHLLGRPPRSTRDFVAFWGRRIRRLLPASLLVLLVTLVATRLFGPETLWENTSRQAGAASLYFVNWLLASDAVDYLAAENVATPVQHYWSLSVEEQFYLVWPLVIGAGVWMAIRWRLPRGPVLGVGLGAIAVASLAWSVHLTRTEPGAAYFVTPTRIWELAAGGLVALWGLGRTNQGASRVRAGVAWLGVAMMLYSILTYDAGTPFPGWTAAVPVLGAALVLAANAGEQWWSPGWILARRPVQWLGDISYSLYLWHWPLVVLIGARVGGELGWTWGSVVVVLSIALAALTKTFVEDRFRSAEWNQRLAATYRLGVLGMAGVLVVAGSLWWDVQRRADREVQRAAEALASNDPCLGAGSMDPATTCAPWEGPPVPAPAQALRDKSEAYPAVSGGKDCWSKNPRYRQITCSFGARKDDAEGSVTLLGNSHAGQWLPALEPVALDRNWTLTTRLASQCPALGMRLQFRTDATSRACQRWGERAVEETIRSAPDLVVLTNRISLPVPGSSRLDSAADYTRAYREVLADFDAAGIPVLVLRDTPAPGDGGAIPSIPDCVAEHGADASDCRGTRQEWIVPATDPAQEAVEDLASPTTSFADLNDRICGVEACDAVVGGVIVYFDASHLTATYARTLAPALAEAVAGAMRKARRSPSS